MFEIGEVKAYKENGAIFGPACNSYSMLMINAWPYRFLASTHVHRIVLFRCLLFLFVISLYTSHSRNAQVVADITRWQRLIKQH